MLHAGVVERDGLALILPATPGSGKSTLTAALSLRGWRLLSDEFGAFDLTSGRLLPVIKPVALKNESIDVIARFEPAAEIGPPFPKTRKGTVAHLAPSAEAVARRAQGAFPGAVILPKWHSGSTTALEPLRPEATFPSLAFNAFNYTSTGADGFRAVAELVRRCPAWQLVYSDLDDALAAIDARWRQHVLGAGTGGVAASLRTDAPRADEGRR
jgi:HprK-related kinase A